jgi:hypothetical protein
MRVRDHIALSTVAAAVLEPWFGREVLGFWAGGVIIDADHYLWFCMRQRRLSLRAAVGFFNEADPPQNPATRAFHTPAALLAVLLATCCRPQMLPFAAGMGLHVGLDAMHELRMDRARAAALRRDGFSCQACGTRGPHVGTHVRRQPRLLPSYGERNLVSLCGACHVDAHQIAVGSGAWS